MKPPCDPPKLRTMLITFALGVCLLVIWLTGYAAGHNDGFKAGRVHTLKEVTKIMVDVGHKMATNALPQRVK